MVEHLRGARLFRRPLEAPAVVIEKVYHKLVQRDAFGEDRDPVCHLSYRENIGHDTGVSQFVTVPRQMIHVFHPVYSSATPSFLGRASVLLMVSILLP